MSTNRVLLFLDGQRSRDRQRREVAEQLAAVAATAGVVELFFDSPDSFSFLFSPPDDWLEGLSVDNARAVLAMGLRDFAEACIIGAERLEEKGGAE